MKQQCSDKNMTNIDSKIPHLSIRQTCRKTFFLAKYLLWSVLLASLSKSVGVRKFFPAWLHTPNLPCILGNRSIRAELAGTGNVHDGHLCPFSLVSISVRDKVLGSHIGCEVCQGQEPVMVKQHVYNVLELIR